MGVKQEMLSAKLPMDLPRIWVLFHETSHLCADKSTPRKSKCSAASLVTVSHCSWHSPRLDAGLIYIPESTHPTTAT